MFTFSKKDKLLKRGDFKRVSRTGIRLVGACMCIDRANSNRPLLGITASKRYGNAPERNRFKRLVREAFRIVKMTSPPFYAINVIPRQMAKRATFDEIKKELSRFLDPS